MICVIRMNPACTPVWPKFELLKLFRLLNVRTLTRLSRFSSSIFNCALFVPNRMFLMNTPSTLYCGGVRTSVMVRGALPYVKAAGAENAAGLIHVAVGWSAEARRFSKLPDVARLPPDVRFGRCMPENVPVLSVNCTLRGKPL